MSDRLVILTWHSVNVLGNHYADNDLIAFSEDLLLLDRLGWTILPLESGLQRLAKGDLPDRAVALTADDGSILDFDSFPHPTCGAQLGLLPRLRRLLVEQRLDNRHQPVISAFVIASPEARAELDRKVTGGLDLWPDHWWREANGSGLMNIESHSWDHNHDVLEVTAQRANRRGDFRAIETEDECRIEVDQASAWIERLSGRRPRFFAYPYGQSSDYLRRDYLPARGAGLGLHAALSCEPAPVSRSSERWHLPRYVCGRDWNSPEEFARLLADAST